jgi:hypothetical protein
MRPEMRMRTGLEIPAGDFSQNIRAAAMSRSKSMLSSMVNAASVNVAISVAVNPRTIIALPQVTSSSSCTATIAVVACLWLAANRQTRGLSADLADFNIRIYFCNTKCLHVALTFRQGINHKDLGHAEMGSLRLSPGMMPPRRTGTRNPEFIENVCLSPGPSTSARCCGEGSSGHEARGEVRVSPSAGVMRLDGEYFG